MIKKTDGYNEDLDYTYGYFSDWTLSKLKLGCIQRGVEPPNIKNACELGFGQGVTINLLGCKSDVNWYGTDFNTNHANYANDLALKSKTNTKIYNMSFDQFTNVKDLPKFDLIVLHGVFAWVSEDNQEIIINFIKKYLNKDGIVYISYNAKPGTDAFKPAQYILNQVKQKLPSSFDTPEKQMKATIEWMNKFHSTNPSYLKAFASIKSRMEKFKEKDISYLIHEYFNDDWYSFYFSEMAEKLKLCDIKYIGQSRYLNDIPALNYTKEQLEFLKSIPQPLNEDLKDSMTNRQFRRDLWMNNPKKLSLNSKDKFIKEQKVILSALVQNINLDININGNKATLEKNFYQTVIDLLSDYKPRTIENIKTKLNFSDEQIIEIVTILNAKNSLSLVQNNETIKKTTASCIAFNNIVLEDSTKDFKLKYLVSPITSEALPINARIIMLHIKTYYSDIKTQEEQIEFIVDYYVKNSLTIQTDIGIAKTKEELYKEILISNKKFEEMLLPFLKAHMIL